jgi:capsular polysaccharide biosynthesis protein
LLLIKSSAVAQRAATAVTPAEAPDDLLGQIDVTASPDANVVSVTATDPDPARAAQVADAFANGFVDFRVDQTKEALSEGQKHLQAQLDGLPATSPAASALQQQITLLKELNAATTSTSADAQVFGTAGIPTAPSSPKPKRDFAVAIIIGLVLGLAIVFLIDLFDRRIKSVDDFETIYRLRSMSSIPQRMTEAATNRDRQAALEPFRILRNSLAYISVKPDIARAAALAGQRVILVECDLRRPTFHQQFDLGGDPRGLTTALIGGVPVSELVRPVHSGLRALTVLPSGPTPPNAAEVFLSAEMRGVLRELSDLADLVVLDCPPLLPVADSHVLLDNPQVDACIVVSGLRDIDGTYDYYGTPDEPAKPGLVTPRA